MKGPLFTSADRRWRGRGERVESSCVTAGAIYSRLQAQNGKTNKTFHKGLFLRGMDRIEGKRSLTDG
jgi:hypothetical protein